MIRLRKEFAVFIAALIFIAFFTPVSTQAADMFISVGLSKLRGVSSAKIDSNSISIYQDVYGQPLYTFQSSQGFTLIPGASGVSVSDGATTLCTLEGVLIQGTDGLTRLSGNTYRGFIKPVNTGSSITIINYVDLEQYLYGVVPSEVAALWSAEAVKAQAVAARSYVVAQTGLNRHPSDAYDICDTTHCQYYPGILKEHERSTDAVNQTAGIMAYYDGQPLNAVFSSSSGGHTENSENVWGSVVPYLRGVKETAEKEFLEWNRTYTFGQLGSGLAANSAGIGDIISVTAEYLPTGRVKKLTFRGTNGTKSYEGDSIRGFSSGIDSSLPSILFKINGYSWSQGGVWDQSSTSGSPATPGGSSGVYILGAGNVALSSSSEIYVSSSAGIPSKLSSGFNALGSAGGAAYPQAQQQSAVSAPATGENTFTITTGTISLTGRGYGHGVGMSQYGAKGMAEAGYDFAQILKHYYTGIEVR